MDKFKFLKNWFGWAILPSLILIGGCNTVHNEHPKLDSKTVLTELRTQKEIPIEYELAVRALETKKFRFIRYRNLDTKKTPVMVASNQYWIGVNDSILVEPYQSTRVIYLSDKAFLGKGYNPNIRNYKFKISRKGKVIVSFSHKKQVENLFIIELPFGTNMGILTGRSKDSGPRATIISGYIVPL